MLSFACYALVEEDIVYGTIYACCINEACILDVYFRNLFWFDDLICAMTMPSRCIS